MTGPKNDVRIKEKMLTKMYESSELVKSVLEKMQTSLISYPIKNPLLLFPLRNQCNEELFLLARK